MFVSFSFRFYLRDTEETRERFPENSVEKRYVEAMLDLVNANLYLYHSEDRYKVPNARQRLLDEQKRQKKRVSGKMPRFH